MLLLQIFDIQSLMKGLWFPEKRYILFTKNVYTFLLKRIYFSLKKYILFIEKVYTFLQNRIYILQTSEYQTLNSIRFLWILSLRLWSEKVASVSCFLSSDKRIV